MLLVHKRGGGSDTIITTKATAASTIPPALKSENTLQAAQQFQIGFSPSNQLLKSSTEGAGLALLFSNKQIKKK